MDRIRKFAEDAGRDPDSLDSLNQIPIMVTESDKDRKAMDEWLTTEWDYASWSESTKESAIIGTVDQCAEQLQSHVDVGVKQIVLVPFKYQSDQIDVLAKEVIPKVNS